MVAKRIITGLLAGLVVGLLLWYGNPYITIAACIVAALAAHEFYRIVRKEHIQPLFTIGICFTILFILAAYACSFAGNYPALSTSFTLPLLLALLTVFPLLWLLFKQNKDNAFINWSWTVAGALYTGGLLSFYISISLLHNATGWLFMVLGCTALCDVFAYVVGSRLGKHPLAASVSAGKTVEGAIGGMAASIVFAVAFTLFFKLPLDIWQMLLAGVIIGVFAQLGDLVESLLKRNMHAKDAGNILPGHGGILDRIDSHLLIAPIAYFLILLVNN
jgi:phosphatidate cytidylyltransferase